MKKIKIKVKVFDMKDVRANINEVIGFLELSDQNALEILRTEFSQYDSILQQGVTLGDDNDPYSGSNEALVRGVACKTGLQSVIKKCDELLPLLKRRLKTLGNVQLGSQIVIGISGASLLTQPVKTIPLITIITGFLTLVGSTLTLFVQHKSGTILNNSQSIFNFYENLVDNRFEAEQQLLEIDIAIQVYKSDNSDRLLNVVSKSNQICLEMRKIMEKI